LGFVWYIYVGLGVGGGGGIWRRWAYGIFSGMF